MKKLLLLLLLVTINVTSQTNPDKFRNGIKTPFTQYNELTTTEKLALPQDKGTVVYDTDLDKLQVFDGVNWVGYFNAALDTTDDIIEGNTNKFLTVFERDKLSNIVFDGNTTTVGIFTGGVSAGNSNSFFGRQSGNASSGGNNSFYGYASGDTSTGSLNSFFGNLSGIRSNVDTSSFFGYSSGSNSLGSDITAIGRGAASFPQSNTLQTPNSTAIGANTIIDKANQAAIGDAAVTELKIGETLVIDKSQIVTGAEGVLVTKKVGGKTVVEVAKEYQELVGVKEAVNGFYNRLNNGVFVANNSFLSSLHEITPNTNYFVTSTVNGSTLALAVYFDENNNFLGFQNEGTNGLDEPYTRELLTIPENTKFIGLSSRYEHATLEYKILGIGSTDIPFLSKNKQGKKILWLGTSIPASGYPQMVGEKIKATVYNEALSSSMARAFHGVTKNFKDLNYINCLRSLSQTISEKQSIMDNWQTNLDSNGLTSSEGGSAPFTFGWRDLLTGNPPADYTTFASTSTILGWSYENKIVAKYLDETNPQFIGLTDYFVFDHGHNDVANPNYDISETDAINVPVVNDDRSNFLGAINFLADVILSYNPRARIMFIGHYENDRKERIWKAQENIANHLDYPFLRLWEKLGFSQRTITTTGFWQSSTVWINSGGSPQNLTMTQVYMQDDLHPFSEPTKELIANSIAPFINNNF